ncbi:MAG: beta-galactosidase [Comamonadaceae bacterium]|nr:beta-galactosidase [Comamonadaceae bacterium]
MRAIWTPAKRYVLKIAEVVRDLQVHRGGPVLMVQVENEYGSFGNDRDYMLRAQGLLGEGRDRGAALHGRRRDAVHARSRAACPGAAIGLDPGTNEKALRRGRPARARRARLLQRALPGLADALGRGLGPGRRPRSSCPTCAGCSTTASPSASTCSTAGRTSASTAGANFSDKYQPDVTSYDYDAPARRGRPADAEVSAPSASCWPATSRPGRTLPGPARAPPHDHRPADRVRRERLGLRQPAAGRSAAAQPGPMESYGQNHGFILYRTRLLGHRGGKLAVTDLHDYANVFADGRYVGTIDRTQGRDDALDIPKAEPANRDRSTSSSRPWGASTTGRELLDRKGITDRVTLNDMTPHGLGRLPAADGRGLPGLAQVRAGARPSGRATSSAARSTSGTPATPTST